MHACLLPRRPVWCCLVLSPLLWASGCHRNDDGAAQTPASTPARTTPAETSSNDPAVTMRYACDAGTTIEVMGADHARALLPDGKRVDMGKVADSSPPVYAGGSLYFKIGSTDAHLSQQDGENELACRPQ